MKQIFILVFWLSISYNSYTQDIFTAIENNDYKKIESIVKKTSEIDVTNSKGVTPLWLATYKEDTISMKLLLDNGANPNAPTSGGTTPIFIPAINGKLILAKILTKYGADVNYNKNTYKVSPLRQAARNGYLEIVRFFIENGAEIDARADDKATALTASCSFGQVDIVRYLIEKGADINIKDKDNDTPLNNACAKGRFDVVKLLIEKGADKSIKDNDGLIAKDIAMKFGFPRIAEYLDK
jgi:uncharacterized protein